MRTRLGLLALIVASAVLSGCATSRSEVALTAPPVTQKAPSNGRTVVIRNVKDDRTFEQAPGDPSTPSLGSGGAAQASDAVKSRAIARKRSTYGQALGDVLLQEGQTVTGLVRSNLAAAFEEAGYRVVADTATQPPPTVVDVSIKKFWAWMQPGFWALTFNSDIETVLTTTAPGAAPSVIKVKASESAQLGTDDAWIRIVQKGMADYRAQAATRLAAPF